MTDTRCHATCWAMPECTVCGRRKPPVGRDVASEAASGYCEHECPGHNAEPRAGHLWPNEHDAECPWRFKDDDEEPSPPCDCDDPARKGPKP